MFCGMHNEIIIFFINYLYKKCDWFSWVHVNYFGNKHENRNIDYVLDTTIHWKLSIKVDHLNAGE